MDGTPPLGLNVALGSGTGSLLDIGFGLLVLVISSKMMCASSNAN
jgi:hypothetical protein